MDNPTYMVQLLSHRDGGSDNQQDRLRWIGRGGKLPTRQREARRPWAKYIGPTTLIVCFLAGASVVLVTTTRTAAGTNNPPASDDFKLTAQSQDRVALMERYMNQSVDPCIDFYEFACGSYGKYEAADTQVFDIMSKAFKERLQAALGSETSPSFLRIETESLQKAQRYYKACVNQSGEENMAAIKAIIEAMGGFRLIGDARPTPDLTDTLSKAMTFSPDTLFSVDFKREGSSSSVRLVFKPHESALLKGRMEKIANFAVKLLPKSVNVTSGLQRLIDFEEKLIEHLNVTSESVLMTEEQPGELAYFSELQNQYDQIINWTRFIKLVGDWANNSKFDTSSFAIFPDLQFMRNLDFFLADEMKNETNRRILHNYLVAIAILPHTIKMPSDFSQRDFCLEDVVGQFPFVVGSIIFEGRQAARKKALALFGQIWESFYQIVSDSPNMNSATKAEMKVKLESLRLEMGVPQWTLEKQSYVDNWYNTFDVTDSSVQNSLNSYRFRIKSQFREQYRTTTSGLKFAEPRPLPYVSLEAEALVGAKDSRIYISPAILQEPLFNFNYTDSLNFGAIGFIFAHELNHILCNGLETNGTDQFLADRKRCISDYYSKYSRYNGAKLLANKTVNDDMCDVGGLQVAYEAFKEVMDASFEEIILPSSGLPLTSNQAFFISFAQTFCNSEKEDEDPESFISFLKLMDDHSPPRFRINGAVSQAVDFAKAFRCPAETPMNPVVGKCQIF